MLKYYELTNKTINHNGVTLHRIRATQDTPYSMSLPVTSAGS